MLNVLRWEILMILFFRRRFLGVALCACLLAGAANAGTATLYNNLPPTYASDGFDNIGNFTGTSIQSGPLADSFSTGSGGFIMNDVQFELQLFGAPVSAVTVQLLSDSSTSPGTVLSTLGTIPDSSVNPVVGGIVDVSFAAITLAANTRYWIELSDPTLMTNVGWIAEQSLGGTGTAGEYNYSFYNGVSANSALTPYQMGIFGPASSAVPEPSSILLLGLSLGTIAVAGRCRNRRAG
jgi:hypothetical protein